jgi:hypothetical protein
MARQKGESVQPTVQTRTKTLRQRFKRLRDTVPGSGNEAAYRVFLAYCEKRLNTFDPQHVSWVDYAAKKQAASAPPKKFVPLRLIEVVRQPGEEKKKKTTTKQQKKGVKRVK